MDIEKLRGGAVPQRRFYLTVCHGRLWEAKEEFFDWMEGS